MADETEEGAREEAEAVIYGAVQDVLDKTGVSPKEIDVLIINCSLFSPTPSLCAMVIHHFQMRSDVLSYNLAGMGCSAGKRAARASVCMCMCHHHQTTHPPIHLKHA